jgi:hypothetical protein
LFRLPTITFGKFQEATNWSNDISVPDDLLVVEPGLYYNSNFDGSLIFTLSDGLEIEIPNEELAGPVRGIDQSGNRVLQNNITVVNILENIVDDTASLGKVSLSQACSTLLIIFLYEILCRLNSSGVSDCQL